MHYSRPFNNSSKRPATRAEFETLNARMMQAIADKDQIGLIAALDAGAHPDMPDGKPLRLCAAQDNYLFAKTLMLAGADIGYAIAQVRAEDNAIPRRTESGLIMVYRTPKTEEGRKQEQAYGEEIKRLEFFQKTFIESTLPLEQMNLLHDIRHAQYDLSRRMDAMEQALRNIDAPKALDKQPAKPRGNGLKRRP